MAAATDLPAVGDWLALEPVSESRRGPRCGRCCPGRAPSSATASADDTGQVLAANVDIAFLVSGLDHDLNLRRLERYLVLAYDGGVTPVVVLNKSDIALTSRLP